VVSRNQVFNHIKVLLEEDKLQLPALPDIALRVKKAIDEQDLEVDDIAKIIQSDIPLAGRVIQIANGPIYRGARPVKHCNDAIIRLGRDVTRNLVTSFALKRLFTAKTSKIRRQTETVWNHSVKVAAISFVLARITLGFDPDRAMLAGIVHDIGVLPFLAYMEIHADQLGMDENTQNELLVQLRGPLGELILRDWGIDNEFLTVAREAERWQRDPSAQADLCDIVLIAQIHASFSDKNIKNRPALDDVPAFKKFPVFSLGPSSSVELLEEASDEIADIKRILS